LLKAALLSALVHQLAAQYQRSPAAVRHRMWVALMLTLAALPLWTWLGPELVIPLPAGSREAGRVDYWLSSVLLAIYLVPVLLRAALLVLSVFRIGWVSLRSKPAGTAWVKEFQTLRAGRRVLLRASHAIDGPLTWGYLRPIVLVPADYEASPQERRMILLHELQHIERGDWLSQLLAKLIEILFWPVPGLSAATRKLSLEAEQACDDHVLQCGVSAPDYAALLVRLARNRQVPATVALAQASELSLRVRNICEACIDHRPALPGTTWLYPLCLLLALPLAALRLTEPAPPPSGHVKVSAVRLVQPARPAGGTDPAQIEKPGRPLSVPAAPPAPPQQLAVPAPPRVEPKWTAPLREPIAPAPVPSVATPDLELQIQPQYPRLALRRGIEGEVTARYDVQPDGRLINMRIVASQPRGHFDASVLDALSAARARLPGGISPGKNLYDLESVFRFRLQGAGARASPNNAP
jgi:TonB family protein